MPRDSRLNIIVSLKDRASKELKRLRRNVEKVNPDLTRAATNARRFSVGLTAVAGSAIYAGKQLADIADQYERTRIAFETMLGDAEEAKEMLDELSEFAKRTPFDIQGIEKTARQLMGMGISAENVMPALKALGDVSAGTGTEMWRLARNFGQVRSKGRMTRRELNDFQMAGVDVTQAIADMTDKTKTQVEEMVTAGEVTFPMVAKAFEKMTSEGGRFDNLMYKMSGTTKGAINALKESWIIFIRESEAVQQLNKAIGRLARDLATFIARDLPQFIELFKEAASWLMKNKVVVMALAGAIMGILVLAFASAASAVAGFLATLAPFMIGGAVIMGVLQAFFEIDKVIAEFIESLKEASDIVGGWGNFTRLVFNQVKATIVKVVHTIVDKMADLAESAYKANQSFGFLTGNGEKMRKAMEDLRGAEVRLQRSLNNLDAEATEMVNTFIREKEEAKETDDAFGDLTDTTFNLGDAVETMGEKSEEAMRKFRDNALNALQKVEDKIWGLADTEIGALQDAKNIYEDKMDIMVERWKEMRGEEEDTLEHYTRAWVDEARKGQENTLEQLKRSSDEYQRYKEKAEELTDEIQGLKMEKQVKPIEDIKRWARDRELFLQEQVSKLGLQMPDVTYPRLQPISPTPQQAVNNFQFNFSGAFIGNPDEFKQEVVNLINRKSELKELGGE